MARKIRLQSPMGSDAGVVMIVDAQTERPVLFVQELDIRFSMKHLNTIRGTMRIKSPDNEMMEEEVEIVRIDYLNPSLVAISS